LAGESDILAVAREVLRDAGFAWDEDRKQFTKTGVPVHLVTAAQIPTPPRHTQDIDDIHTVGLADLISIKLRSGTTDPLRAQDLADVIGLIRCHALTAAFTPQIDRDVRAEFRKLAKQIADHRPRR